MLDESKPDKIRPGTFSCFRSKWNPPFNPHLSGEVFYQNFQTCQSVYVFRILQPHDRSLAEAHISYQRGYQPKKHAVSYDKKSEANQEILK